ncbi:MAG TPA: lanthionine synthetase LanC family protein [Candidatus Angelobacter sp.]
MNITDPWVLPRGVIITPVEKLPAKVREQVDARDDDFAISRPQSRTTSRILDSQAAALLRQFETPNTIAQAVIDYSQDISCDPERMLEEALPMLLEMIDSRLLVPPDSEKAGEIEPSWQAGDRVAECEVLQCFQALEDSEIYQVRRISGEMAALKILRAGSRAESHRMFDREAAILRHLAGTVAPALLDAGVWEGRPYLLLEWCEGLDVGAAAAQMHSEQSVEAQRKLLDLCCQILRTYSLLHGQGVIHSDIHPGNIVVDETNRVRLVDFGLAWEEKTNREFGEPLRGGVGFYFEPEYAEAAGKGQQPPGASRLGEQYALAALIYSLLTGAHYLDFFLGKEQMMRQILEAPPVPFARRSLAPWPEVESILFRALSKNPSARFASVSEFADALSVVEAPERGWLSGASAVDPSALDRVVERSIARVGFSESLVRTGLSTAPKSSVTFGAAGIAYALYRIACQRSDSALLSLADVWCSRAAFDPDTRESYYNPELEITPETVGLISPYHTLSGVHAVQTLVSHAMCDVASQAAALQGFIEVSQKPCDNLDLALGRSGTLLLASLLLDTLEDGDVPIEPLLDFGNHTMNSIWREIEKQPAVREGTKITYLGIAHGWAGILYAALNWHRSSSAKLPSDFEERLQQLADCAEPARRGLRWPCVLPQGRQGGRASYMPGWCNGSAGHIFLLTAAHGVFHEDSYLRLAEWAAWHAWESRDSISNLCCGLAGQAYGLLNFYKHTGENVWLERAKELAARAAEWDTSSYAALKFVPESLYKGEMGVALLAAELSAPQTACMPFFEPEGWSKRLPANILPCKSGLFHEG